MVGQVGGHQALHRVCLVQRAQLDEQRDEVGQLDRDPPGQLPQREGLAAPEVAQHQDEPAVVGRDLPEQLFHQVIAYARSRAVQRPEPLRDIQVRRVQGIGGQPGGLLLYVVPQVEQALELDEAAQPHTAPRGLLPQQPGRLRALIDQLRAGLGLIGVNKLQEGGQHLPGRLTHVRGHPPLADELVFLVGDQQMRQVPFRAPDLGPLVPRLTRLGDAVKQQAGRARGAHRLQRPGRGIFCRRGFHVIGTIGGEGPAGRVPPHLQVAGLVVVAAGAPAVESVRGEPEQLMLADSGGGHHQQPGAKLVGLVAARPRAVQQQVEPRCDQLVERLDVAEQRWVTFGRRVARYRVVADYADPQPALPLEAGEPLSEPCGLGLADPAVMIFFPVAARYRRVQPGYHDLQVLDRKQRPRLHALERRAVQAPVELLEQAGEVTPLRPVRRLRLDIVRLAVGEVGTRRRRGDVVAAGHDRDAVRLQTEQRAQPGQKVKRLVAFASASRFSQVAGDHEQVRPGHAGSGQPGDVSPYPGLQVAGGQVPTPAG